MKFNTEIYLNKITDILRNVNCSETAYWDLTNKKTFYI